MINKLDYIQDMGFTAVCYSLIFFAFHMPPILWEIHGNLGKYHKLTIVILDLGLDITSSQEYTQWNRRSRRGIPWFLDARR